MSIFNNNSFNNNHQLISREQNYTIECKKLSIHSEDRDIKMWPDADEFEITCPQSYNNVQSVSLAQISLPDIFYNFSEELENTKICFKDIESSLTEHLLSASTVESYNNSLTSITASHIRILRDPQNIDSITIPNGSYTYENLAKILESKINSEFNQGHLITVKYSSLQHKFIFLSPIPFILFFNKEMVYNTCSKIKKNLPYKNINWGLPYFLGFQKKEYTNWPGTNIYNNDDSFEYYKEGIDYGKYTSSVSDIYGISMDTINYCFVASQYPIPSAFYKNTIYMELNKMNNMDEIKPYVNNTTSLCNYDYNGMINNSFAKIIYKNISNTCQNNIKWETIYDNKNDKAIITFDPPLEKLNKFKVKFRYHDGTPVNFLNNEINITLEMVLLKNEIARAYNVRVPPVYTF